MHSLSAHSAGHLGTQRAQMVRKDDMWAVHALITGGRIVP